jgi:hypothetical protein
VEDRVDGTTGDTTAKRLRARLEHGEATAGEAVQVLANAALEAPTRTARLDACRLPALSPVARSAPSGTSPSGRRSGCSRRARLADTAADRRGVLAAMGRGFRNPWLLPFVHRRLSARERSWRSG